ncbi:MAG: LemA family protein [Chryseobacterium sp.]|jgi:LemA protein|uniref:LemA family protein n=1 Tax=Chryseobacterium sp. TaxID=1871047 RepID=UPI00282CE61F|nr:LemA family protein [Chryseobacterium sp.]MDR2237764.1 LemA family protein [Chryseobacterium sp.]
MSSFIPLFITIIIVVGLVTFLINTYNRLVILNNNAKKAFANIDVILKQRSDEIPNLVNVVKATAFNENTVLRELVTLRSQYLGSHEDRERIKTAERMDGKLKSVMLTIENYPEIKSGTSYLELQKRLSDLEEIIADRRIYFNESVNLYNTGIETFPDIIFAKMMSYRKKEMLHFEDTEKQNNTSTL